MENTAKFQQTFFKQCGVLTVVCGNVMVIGNNFLSSDGNKKKSDFICLHFFSDVINSCSFLFAYKFSYSFI